MSDRIVAQTDRFPHRTIDDETVLIDAERGHLFLLGGLGSWLWGRLTAGGTIEEVVAEVVDRYGDDAAAPVQQFVESLEEHELVGPEPTGSGASAASAVGPPPEVFETPEFQHFDEIADIVAMDPIHEVEPSKGWPLDGSADLADDLP